MSSRRPASALEADKVPDPASTPPDIRSLATSLGPALLEQHEGRLTDIRWFRADWQRGGAATAHATLTDEGGLARPVIIKVPVRAGELLWTRRLQTDETNPVVPRLFASGSELGGYDLAWLVLEDLPYGPLGARWCDTTIPRMAHAAARFYRQTGAYPIDHCALREDWDDLIAAARQSVKSNLIDHHQRWTTVLRKIQGSLDQLVTAWRARPVHDWVHGDLHPANALCRQAGDDADVVLIDLADVHPGHWVEDAVYLERLLWTQPDRLRAHKPVREIARARKEAGLEVGDDYARLATIRRVLLAASAPRFMKTEGSRVHLEACLVRLEGAASDVRQLTTE